MTQEVKSTKEQIADHLYAALELLRAGNYTIDGLPSTDPKLEDANSEMDMALRAAIDTIWEYME